jgi:hypothetical protein
MGSASRVLSVGRALAGASMTFVQSFEKQSTSFCFETQLTTHHSGAEIAHTVGIIVSLHFLVFTKVNTVLVRLPMDGVWRLIRELQGFLKVTCLIQGVIELSAEGQTRTGDSVFFHGIPIVLPDLRNLQCSLVGEVVVWSGSTRASAEVTGFSLNSHCVRKILLVISKREKGVKYSL